MLYYGQTPAEVEEFKAFMATVDEYFEKRKLERETELVKGLVGVYEDSVARSLSSCESLSGIVKVLIENSADTPERLKDLLKRLNKMHSDESFRKRIFEIRALQDGWFDGDGIAPSKELMDWFEEWYFELSEGLMSGIPHPYIFPESEGGLVLEWILPRFSPSLDIDANHKVGWFHSIDPDGENGYIESDIDLGNPNDTGWVEDLRDLFRRGEI